MSAPGVVAPDRVRVVPVLENRVRPDLVAVRVHLEPRIERTERAVDDGDPDGVVPHHGVAPDEHVVATDVQDSGTGGQRAGIVGTADLVGIDQAVRGADRERPVLLVVQIASMGQPESVDPDQVHAGVAGIPDRQAVDGDVVQGERRARRASVWTDSDPPRTDLDSVPVAGRVDHRRTAAADGEVTRVDHHAALVGTRWYHDRVTRFARSTAAWREPET